MLPATRRDVQQSSTSLSRVSTIELGKFKRAFPQYREFALYGAVAAIKYDAGLERLAEKRGLFVFQPSGEIMTLANTEDFRPKAY